MKRCFALALIISACNGQLRLEDDLPLDAGIGGGAPVGINDAGSNYEDAALVQTDASLAEPSDAATNTGCTKDEDCKLSSLHCDPVSATCVACTLDAHCTDSRAPRCDAALHRCVECGIAADCAENARCETVTRRCVRSCDSLDDCQLETPLCDLDRGFCRRCYTDIECLIDDLKRCETTNGKCVACTSNEHCPSNTPHCDRSTGSCAECLTETHCAQDSFCDPHTRTCVKP